MGRRATESILRPRSIPFCGLRVPILMPSPPSARGAGAFGTSLGRPVGASHSRREQKNRSARGLFLTARRSRTRKKLGKRRTTRVYLCGGEAARRAARAALEVSVPSKHLAAPCKPSERAVPLDEAEIRGSGPCPETQRAPRASPRPREPGFFPPEPRVRTHEGRRVFLSSHRRAPVLLVAPGARR